MPILGFVEWPYSTEEVEGAVGRIDCSGLPGCPCGAIPGVRPCRHELIVPVGALPPLAHSIIDFSLFCLATKL
jgi:hypothetical protein